ncbi:SUKH-3 domain-containing protein [Prosthecobacter vanneervenii]|uniref:Uncharacterized protein n=1 Tax=Prosthecobacter vanneervenii TaxID=48466 RepID=A0A7W7YG15_9BACT|nr:SUKH-3 domain-containing protein [Prosthecobacter vanneervenii]MBB5035528.1 hypothetical protein [Prosthecobacter vanneervenii]
MQKLVSLFRIAIRSIKLGFAQRQPQAWELELEKFRVDQAGRTRAALQLLAKLSDAARRRFSEPVLLRLLAAGWREGRRLPPEELAALQAVAAHPFPTVVTDGLSEFGGLTLYPHSGLGRFAWIGEVDKDLTEHQSQLERLLERSLHPIGFSNIFDDDGLVIYSDDAGRLFADGEMGSENPGDSRIDYLAASFDRALEIMLRYSAKSDEWPGVPASGMWCYNKVSADAAHSIS